MEKHAMQNTNQKEDGMAIALRDQVDFRTRRTTGKKLHYE